MKILVTGGAGYIGSHTLVELINSGFTPVVVDNFSNSARSALDRVKELTEESFQIYEVDVTDREGLRGVFESEKNIKGAIHFAGLKSVGESVELPLKYFDVNVGGSIVLAELMCEFGISNLLFSSSATVYGEPQSIPINESFPTGATNPYGRSKLFVEEIYKDLCSKKDNEMKVGLLRYFNPIGAHESGRIGEDPNGIPNNLVPYISQVAIGKLPKLNVFGNDYDTPDGTGVRDYIHVVDLARGHIKALQKLLILDPGCKIWNLGTGRGYSVLEVVHSFEEISGKQIPLEFVERRTGDIAECYADVELVGQELSWTAQFGIKRMIEDTWRWQQKNPNGYKE